MAPAEIVEWDTAFFGVKIARVRGGVLTLESAAAIDAWCAREGVQCVYLLAPAGDLGTIRAAENQGYRLVDVSVTLRCGAGGPVRGARRAVRPARASDLAALLEMSRECFHQTRFYNDPNFPRPKVRELYETWVRRSLEGWADAVLVAEANQAPAGFVTCHREGARIGLLGVGARARGAGIGASLAGAALDWFRAEGAGEVSVATQGANRSALRLYGRCGFTVHAVELWYHRWPLL